LLNIISISISITIVISGVVIPDPHPEFA